MKRVIACFCMLLTALGLAACGNTAPIQPPEQSASILTTSVPTVQSQDKNASGRILIAYFSCTGTTEKIAQYAADILGADIYKIVPETPYTQADLNYNDPSSRGNREQNDPSARPAISGSVQGMENYDTVILGYPVWHGQAPRIISTFLESYDFGGKTVAPFCTSHSSGIGSSDTNLHGLCPDTVTWLTGRRFPADADNEIVKEWIDSMNMFASEAETVGAFNFDTKISTWKSRKKYHSIQSDVVPAG